MKDIGILNFEDIERSANFNAYGKDVLGLNKDGFYYLGKKRYDSGRANKLFEEWCEKATYNEPVIKDDVILFMVDGKPTLILTKDGFIYKRKIIKRVGKAYKLFNAWLDEVNKSAEGAN